MGYERSRYSCLYNRKENRVIIVDTYEKRLLKMHNTILAWATVAEEYQKENKTRMVMVGLTYRNIDDYQGHHIGDYLRNVKKRLGKNILGYAWVAEMQKRGAVHYHIIMLLKPGSDLPKPDKKGYWVHGSSKIVTARSPYYLVTYVGKEYQKDLSKYPKSCRLYSASVRWGEKAKQRYRLLAGLSGENKNGGENWEYNGSCVTENYTKRLREDAERIVGNVS